MLSALQLDISDPQASLLFYVEQLGMQLVRQTRDEETGEGLFVLAYDDDARVAADGAGDSPAT